MILHNRFFSKILQIWLPPWGYMQAVLVSVGLFLAGILIHLFSDSQLAFGVSLPSWPWNIILLFVYCCLLFVFVLVSKQSAFVRWLGGSKVSVVAMVFVGTTSFFAGTLPQTKDSLSWTSNVITSWPFVFALLLLMTNLGLVVFRRLLQRRFEVGFLLNHIGLFIVMLGMSFGSPDIQRYKIPISENETAQEAVDPETGSQITLPFSIFLKDFQIEEYPATFAMIDHETGDYVMGLSGARTKFEAKTGAKGRLSDWEISVIDYLPSGERTKDGYEAVKGTAGVQAAFVEARYVGPEHTYKVLMHAEREITLKPGDTKKGWVARPSDTTNQKVMMLGKYLLAMTEPQTKVFRSLVQIEKGGEKMDSSIEVNKPLSVKGWKLYQASYDANMGKFSTLSVFDAVRDPWLPFVYFGVFLMLAGIVHIFMNGFTIWKRK